MARANAFSNDVHKNVAVLTATPLTFSCYYKSTTLTGSQSLVAIGSTTASTFYLMEVVSGKLRARASAAGTSSPAASVASISTTAWNHCCAVFSSSTSRTIYLNGVSASDSTSIAPSGASLNRTSIGSVFSNSVSQLNFATGSLAFPAIWNIALTAADVAALVALQSPRLAYPSNLVAYARLTGGLSPEPDWVSSTGWTLFGTPTETANPPLFAP